MNLRRRNSTGQFTSSYPHQTNSSSELDMKKEMSVYVNYLFFVIKVVLLVVLVYPFIDKIRQTELMAKVISYASQIDIGCKPCFPCNRTTTEINTKLNNGL